MLEAAAIGSRWPMNITAHTKDTERKILLMLRILQEQPGPVGATVIARRLHNYGVALSERTVRYHLRLMDERGLTVLMDRHDGRQITDLGLEELKNAGVQDKVGFCLARIEVLAYRTALDLERRQGPVPVNISLIPVEQYAVALEAMRPAFQYRLCVSDLVASARAGERIGNALVPAGYVGFATVCSVVVNGVLLKHGIPMDSKFGGLLQYQRGKAHRFVELIAYSGTSLDPSEVVITGRLTSVRSAAERGEGKILANFREVPALSRPLMEELFLGLQALGIHGVLAIGEMSEPLCQTPVDVNKVGLILTGGLNPIACACEAGLTVTNHAMSSVMPYEQLQSFWTLCPGRA